MFGGTPPDEWLEALEDDEQELEIEPDCWPTVQAWMRIQTQWRTTFGGYTGLDYPAVFQVLDRLKIADPDGELFAGLQVMEFAALKAMKD